MDDKQKKLWQAGLLVFAVLALGIAVFSVCGSGGMGRKGGSFMWFGGKVVLKNTEEFETVGIENIDITYSSENVIFFHSDNESIVIKEYLRKNRKDETRMEKEGNTLVVEKTDGVSFSFFGGWWGNERIEVYLPKDYKGNIKTRVSSGNIQTNVPLELGTFELKASSGNITCGEITASEFTAEASSGNITVEAVDALRKCRTTSGNITVRGGNGDTRASANSGNIDVREISGSFDGSATSGNIDVDFVQAGSKITASASSGNVEIKIPEETWVSYEGSASSGNIKTDFDDSLTYNREGKYASGTYAGGGTGAETEIRTDTTSGNIRVRFR